MLTGSVVNVKYVIIAQFIAKNTFMCEQEVIRENTLTLYETMFKWRITQGPFLRMQLKDAQIIKPYGDKYRGSF